MMDGSSRSNLLTDWRNGEKSRSHRILTFEGHWDKSVIKQHIPQWIIFSTKEKKPRKAEKMEKGMVAFQLNERKKKEKKRRKKARNLGLLGGREKNIEDVWLQNSGKITRKQFHVGSIDLIWSPYDFLSRSRVLLRVLSERGCEKVLCRKVGEIYQFFSLLGGEKEFGEWGKKIEVFFGSKKDEGEGWFKKSVWKASVLRES